MFFHFCFLLTDVILLEQFQVYSKTERRAQSSHALPPPHLHSLPPSRPPPWCLRGKERTFIRTAPLPGALGPRRAQCCVCCGCGQMQWGEGLATRGSHRGVSGPYAPSAPRLLPLPAPTRPPAPVFSASAASPSPERQAGRWTRGAHTLPRPAPFTWACVFQVPPVSFRGLAAQLLPAPSSGPSSGCAVAGLAARLLKGISVASKFWQLAGPTKGRHCFHPLSPTPTHHAARTQHRPLTPAPASQHAVRARPHGAGQVFQKPDPGGRLPQTDL